MNKETGIGIIALFAGAILGGIAAWTAKDAIEGSDLDVLDDEPAIAPYHPSEVKSDLQGCEVPGDQADLVKVRVLGLERAKGVAMWGSKGLNHDQPTTFRLLTDLTTDHLLAIKENSTAVTTDELRLIDSILEDREVEGGESYGV